MKNNLLLSLGHNSSAIFIDSETKEVTAYEQERLDKKKSSSAFPKDAIEQIIKQVGINKLHEANVFITHWFDNLTYQAVETDLKYNDKEYIELLKGFNCNIVTHVNNFTHHDAHAWSSYSFFKYHYLTTQAHNIKFDKLHFIVADGFGNKQEVLSIYELDNKEDGIVPDLKLIKRIYNYNYSLGLYYQYATSFVGMKENQDEYKFLGYESHIKEFFSDELIEKIDADADDIVLRWMKLGFRQATHKSGDTDFINLDALNATKEDYYKQFEALLNIYGSGEKNSFQSRTLVGYFIQRVVEGIMLAIIKELKIENLCVSGGLFYNVKLNNRLLKYTNLFCAMPLAGDQGASIGFYEKYIGNFPWSDKLLWGKRDVNRKTFDEDLSKYGNAFHFTDKKECIEFCAEKIANGEIVNLIGNKMEYGPRALCNTSSIFLPQQNLAEINNALNHRNEVMPLAPVMLYHNVYHFFDLDLPIKVVGSDNYMIVTYDYNSSVKLDTYSGVMHKYPKDDNYSGRPQVVEKETLIGQILKEVQNQTNIMCLVNTSYNYHGFPIAYSLQDVAETNKKQLENKKILKDAVKKEVNINVVVYDEQ